MPRRVVSALWQYHVLEAVSQRPSPAEMIGARRCDPMRRAGAVAAAADVPSPLRGMELVGTSSSRRRGLRVRGRCIKKGNSTVRSLLAHCHRVAVLEEAVRLPFKITTIHILLSITIADHDRFGDGRCGEKKESDDEKKLLLQLKRSHFEAIESGRKRWEGRPLVERRKDGSIAPWKFRHLATEGRVVRIQCGPPPTLRMRVAEVRYFVPNERSSIPPEQAMVKELGTDLLPDVADANARVQVYRELYGADICARGFVAMRLEWADEIKATDESSTLVKEALGAADVADTFYPGGSRPRTCASPRRCGNIGCDNCYPPGDSSVNKRKGARRA